jgi:hypothetical protein
MRSPARMSVGHTLPGAAAFDGPSFDATSWPTCAGARDPTPGLLRICARPERPRPREDHGSSAAGSGSDPFGWEAFFGLGIYAPAMSWR